MQSTDYPSNPKYLAISAHASQGGPGGLLSYALHKDEYFWPENILGTNHPPIVNAGTDQTVKPGDAVHLDGSQSKDPDGDTLTFQWVQRSGTPVTLTGATTAAPAFTAPTGLNQDETLTFELTVSDGQFTSTPDAVSVRVDSRSNIASLATVTASSQNSVAAQTADKAVDGVIDGYPGDVTREWATVGEGVGAWIKLSWPVPYAISRIVLYDRPNLNDGIISATLTFSDGSSVAIGALNNDGTATELIYPAKVITDLTLTVTGVSSTTTNVGLAEIQVYGYASSQTQYSVTVNEFPAGAGTVAITPSKASYYQGEQVTLTATPSSGYLFSSWSGDATGTASPVTVTVDANKTITANFTPFGLSSISVNPAGVTGGTTAQGTVTLNSPAPSGGTVVALSGDSSAAGVPASVTVPAGSASADFTITTTPVAASTPVTISAVYAGVAKTTTLTVNPPTVSAVIVNPSSVTGGTASQGTVTLNGPAPSGGAVVALSGNSSAATVQESVTIPESSTSATFTIATTPVATSTAVTISAAYAGVSKSATLTVNQPVLTSLSIAPSTVTSGTPSQGTVRLNGPAPAGGITVSLSSNKSPVAAVPSGVTVAEGSATASFGITTYTVTKSTPVTIAAAYGGVSQTAKLTVNAPAGGTVTVTLSPATITGGASSTGTVKLSAAAPTGGLVITLSADQGATLPASVTVPRGATTATFIIGTVPVAAATPVIISASSGTSTATATLTVNPPALTALTLSPSSILGGTSSTGTATISGPAPSGGLIVVLAGNSSSVAVPESVAIPEGATTASFTITTTPVVAATPVTISAMCAGVTKTATLTVNPLGLSSLTLSPTSVKGGTNSQGTVTLNGPAPLGGITIALSDNSSNVTVPASVTISEGSSSTTFAITTTSVKSSTTATISASYGGATVTATLKLTK